MEAIEVLRQDLTSEIDQLEATKATILAVWREAQKPI